MKNYLLTLFYDLSQTCSDLVGRLQFVKEIDGSINWDSTEVGMKNHFAQSTTLSLSRDFS